MTFEDHKFLRLARLPFRHPGKILRGLYRLQLKSAMMQILQQGTKAEPEGSTKNGELGIHTPGPRGFGVPKVLKMFDEFEEWHFLSTKMVGSFQEISPLGYQHGQDKKNKIFFGTKEQ